MLLSLRSHINVSTMKQDSNVIKVPPRRKTVSHKGMFGIIEYHPAKKIWSSIIKFVHTVTHRNEHPTEAHAELEVKRLIDVAAQGKSKNVRTVE